jgi:hypothetical protein
MDDMAAGVNHQRTKARRTEIFVDAQQTVSAKAVVNLLLKMRGTARSSTGVF